MARSFTRLRADLNLFEVAGTLLAVALAGERCFHALFLARLQVVGVTLDLLDDVLLLHFALETAQCGFQGLTVLDGHLSQSESPPFFLNYQF
jgi:hypothetical protein